MQVPKAASAAHLKKIENGRYMDKRLQELVDILFHQPRNRWNVSYQWKDRETEKTSVTLEGERSKFKHNEWWETFILDQIIKSNPPACQFRGNCLCYEYVQSQWPNWFLPIAIYHAYFRLSASILRETLSMYWVKIFWTLISINPVTRLVTDKEREGGGGWRITEWGKTLALNNLPSSCGLYVPFLFFFLT